MAITPDELLQTADELAQGNRESDWRNATSRAYYAAYHACIPFAFGSASAEPGHREIADRLTRPTAAMHSRSVGYLLDQCRALRERADYRINADFLRGDANTTLRATRRIFDIVKAA